MSLLRVEPAFTHLCAAQKYINRMRNHKKMQHPNLNPKSFAREDESTLCEFGGLNENSKVMFLFVGEELTREGVIVEKDRVERRLRMLEEGKTSRGAW